MLPKVEFGLLTRGFHRVGRDSLKRFADFVPKRTVPPIAEGQASMMRALG